MLFSKENFDFFFQEKNENWNISIWKYCHGASCSHSPLKDRLPHQTISHDVPWSLIKARWDIPGHGYIIEDAVQLGCTAHGGEWGHEETKLHLHEAPCQVYEQKYLGFQAFGFLMKKIKIFNRKLIVPWKTSLSQKTLLMDNFWPDPVLFYSTAAFSRHDRPDPTVTETNRKSPTDISGN